LSPGGPDPTASDSFCILPWLHLEVLPEGTTKACCVAQEMVHEGGAPLSVERMSVDAIRNSDYLRSLRTALASGSRVPVCSSCWNQEKRGETSVRQGWNASFSGAVEGLSARTRAGEEPTAALPLAYLQVGLGNTCNLACRMCNATYSSRIAEDPVHNQWSPRMDPGRTVWEGSGPQAQSSVAPAREAWIGGRPWFEQPEFFRADLLANSSSLRVLYVTGGEPLMSEDFAKLLDDYAEKGHAQNLALTINSNVFHNEQRLRKSMDSLLRFAACTLGASIDGYGAVYEYIRYPARWDVIERNLRILKSLSEQNPQLTLILDTVVQPYNCLSLTELLRFADELGVACYPHMIEGPYFLQMKVVPRALRLLAAERLRAYAGSPTETGLDAASSANRAHALRLALHLESIQDAFFGFKQRRQFADFTRALDESRHQSLAESVPELAALLR
jgi:pyruvate-formate lyase-activating enzyme